jgi:hypothetical protein
MTEKTFEGWMVFTWDKYVDRSFSTHEAIAQKEAGRLNALYGGQAYKPRRVRVTVLPDEGEA